MVRAVPDGVRQRRNAWVLLLMLMVTVAALIASASPGLRAAVLPDRQAAGLVGTLGAFGLALVLGDVLHLGWQSRARTKG